MQIPEDLRYTENHEWVRSADDGIITVGISDYAQDALGDVVYVDLPDVGREIEAGEVFAEVESTKSVNDVYAPVSGVVSAVNDPLYGAAVLWGLVAWLRWRERGSRGLPLVAAACSHSGETGTATASGTNSATTPRV